MPRQLAGRSQDGGGAEAFGFLQRGFSSGIRSARLRGSLLGSPPPLLAELVAGSSGFLKPLRPLGHQLVGRTGLSRLLRKGKARAALIRRAARASVPGESDPPGGAQSPSDSCIMLDLRSGLEPGIPGPTTSLRDFRA